MSGQLDNSSADALATAICTALNITETKGRNEWKTICETIYSHLKSDVTITIQSGTIVTNGSPTTQSGPPAPININPN